MYKMIWLSMVLLVVSGCGRKEAPQALVDAGPPTIVSLQVMDAEPSKKLAIRLGGGEGGIGYQMERAEMDPYCKCPSEWRRYYEEPTQTLNYTRVLERMIRLEVGGHDYVYRLRAVDATGRLGAWRRLKAFEK
jgi:hypothetical protein